MDKISEIKSRIPATAENIKYTPTYDEVDEQVFDNVGIGMSASAQAEIASKPSAYGFDAAPALQTTPSVSTPIQFLQWWSPSFIRVIFQKRMADIIMGITNAGRWEDMEAVIREVESTGNVGLYGDATNSINQSWNLNFIKRAVVRFRADIMVSELEARQSAAMNVNSKSEKMVACTNALEQQRNSVAFRGFLNGTEANYGLLNDPRLPDYQTLPVGTSGLTTFASKTFLEITQNIQAIVQNLQTKLGGNFDPQTEAFTMVLPVSVAQFLATVSQYGNSVMDFIEKTYPKMEIKTCTQFDSALGGQNVLYVFKNDIDGEKTIEQWVQQKMFLVGFEKRSTYTLETYSNATAGVIAKYGIGFVRYVGC